MLYFLFFIFSQYNIWYIYSILQNNTNYIVLVLVNTRYDLPLKDKVLVFKHVLYFV